MVAPERLQAHKPDIASTADGFVWRVHRRSPLFQRTISGLVEGSTEAGVVAWMLALTQEVPPDGLDWGLPAWLAAQLLALGLVLVWEGRGRTVVRTVRLTDGRIHLDLKSFSSSDLEAVDVHISGWGLWRSAEVTLRPRRGVPVRFAADGEPDATLHQLAERLKRVIASPRLSA